MNRVRLTFQIGPDQPSSRLLSGILSRNAPVLRDRGLFFAGRLFENLPRRLYSWQRPEGLPELNRIADGHGAEEFERLLVQLKNFCEIESIRHVIVNNESFFSCMGKLLDVERLARMEGLGFNVDFISYIPTPSSWAVNEYLDRALCSKSFKGRLRPFSSWVSSQPFEHYSLLADCVNLYAGRILLRSAMNAHVHFESDLGLLNVLNANELLTERGTSEMSVNTELFLRALFNDKNSGAVGRARYDALLESAHIDAASPQGFIDRLMPTEADMKRVADRCASDLVKVNEMLVAQGQEPLKEPSTKTKTLAVDYENLLLGLAQVVVEQAKAIDMLEQALERIKKVESD